ncbi:hypothetical protein LTR62_007749 [Meristemomyces frigidus]|uniref:Zn(2)-C6 fungal-type domain-containing protein n=1 Tax=Meristemomyces frigidus TaxID=1508187 RepID=A0AAN7TE85_9PEZI|nr:hypothetical protein LTR62_007749 [Meristemomyces frigidus]
MMNTNTSAPTGPAHTKQYVFVDEYNRHKRLKVMRACDGCRKRKIKCDGALQNGPWPCGACVRLKLQCAPPSLDPDEEQDGLNVQTAESLDSTSFTSGHDTAAGVQSPSAFGPQSGGRPSWTSHPIAPAVPIPGPSQPPSDITVQYYGRSTPQPESLYSGEYFASLDGNTSQFRPSIGLYRTGTEASGSSHGDEDPGEVDANVRSLSTHMGDLSIDVTTAAPYIINENRSLPDMPVVEDLDSILPVSVRTDATIRIPPEMMPCEERAIELFDYYFDYIHPYTPVLDRPVFYRQWRTERHAISPLILEGIFACVARYLDQPIELRRWLALASRHEEAFKDVPRLSSVQALILLTKAREFVPIRGYYYRSWMTVKYMTAMAFDLGLHEHLDQHRSGKQCPFESTDCTIRTRVWQSLFLLEAVIGAPQGRTDYAVDLETVEMEVPAATAATIMDSFEYSTSRRFTYMTQTFHLIKITNNLWRKNRRAKQDWALDSAFVQHNQYLQSWHRQLPDDMQLHYPEDGTPPWLNRDHFVAYMHIYFHLVVVMHHRPQLQALLERRDQGFRAQLEICLDSAIQMCRVQEALFRDFGLHGLTFMLRGVGFTIYCVLTCAMLHLAAVTSPDPELNGKARIYFTRHMRVLEHCITTATPEIRAQINNLREAFSADTSQPFELKSSLGVRSPSVDSHPTPPKNGPAPHQASLSQSMGWQHLQDGSSSKMISPVSEYSQPYGGSHGHTFHNQPMNAYSSANYQMAPQASYPTNPIEQVTSAPQTGYGLERVISNEQQLIWDPSGIFHQWNSAFGGQPRPQQSPPATHAPVSTMNMTSMPGLQHNQLPTSAPAMYSSQQQLPPNNVGGPLPENTLPTMPTVTPVMWQDAFTTAFVSGQGNKRYRPGDAAVYDPYAKRRG